MSACAHQPSGHDPLPAQTVFNFWKMYEEKKKLIANTEDKMQVCGGHLAGAVASAVCSQTYIYITYIYTYI